jgi:hypothetical protein
LVVFVPSCVVCGRLSLRVRNGHLLLASEESRETATFSRCRSLDAPPNGTRWGCPLKNPDVPPFPHPPESVRREFAEDVRRVTVLVGVSAGGFVADRCC